jgi:hypothetical protein
LIIVATAAAAEFLRGICTGPRRCLPEADSMPLDGPRLPTRNCGFLVIEPASQQPVQRYNLGVLAAGIG